MIHTIRDATIRPVPPGVEPFEFWTRTSLGLELAITTTAAAAGVLTAGALVQWAGGAPLFVPRAAALAWIACACLAVIGYMTAHRLTPGAVARHRRPLVVLLPSVLIWVGLGVLRPTIGAGDGLAAEYFSNSEWNG
jgi:hypothetical protein